MDSPFVDLLVPANCVLIVIRSFQIFSSGATFNCTKNDTNKPYEYKIDCRKRWKYQKLLKVDHDRAGMTTTSKHPHMPIYHARLLHYLRRVYFTPTACQHIIIKLLLVHSTTKVSYTVQYDTSMTSSCILTCSSTCTAT